MKVIGKSILEEFKIKHSDICSRIDAWYAEATKAEWKKPLDIKQRYSAVSILSNDHVVFNLKGNKYRLLVQINYKNQIVLIRKVGTHNEYMNWQIE